MWANSGPRPLSICNDREKRTTQVILQVLPWSVQVSYAYWHEAGYIKGCKQKLWDVGGQLCGMMGCFMKDHNIIIFSSFVKSVKLMDF